MQVVIIGAGGHGRVVLDIVRTAGVYEPVGFVDASPSNQGATVDGLPVFGSANVLSKLRQQGIDSAIVAIGECRARIRYAQLLDEHGFTLINAIHPVATVSKTAQLGKNNVIAAGAIVGTHARVGNSTILNTGCVVDHECELDEGVHVCPGTKLAGRVRVGRGTWVGIGATVIQCISIGEYATVGAGAVVIRDVPAYATVVGVPARVLRVQPPGPDPIIT